MNTKKIFFLIDLFLIADGILSIYWGKSCSDMCFNNSNWGNAVRVARILSGATLALYFRK